MKLNWIYIKAFVLLVVVLFLFGFTNYRNEHQKVKSIDIKFEQGNNLFMTYEMVDKLLIQNGKPVKNQAKTLIDLNKLEKQVLSHPMVENSDTYITVDGQLKVSVKQRTPIGRVNTNNNSFYIDRKGQFMPLSNNYSARVPIVTGISVAEDTADLFQLLSFIALDAFFQKQIVGVHKMQNGDFILRSRVGTHKIDFGSIEDMEKKFKKLKAFYSYAMQDETIDKYKGLSLKYNNQVVATKK